MVSLGDDWPGGIRNRLDLRADIGIAFLHAMGHTPGSLKNRITAIDYQPGALLILLCGGTIFINS